MLCAAFSILVLGVLQVQPLEVSGEAGFGGFYRPGAWTPAVLDLHNPNDERELLIILCWAAPGHRQETLPTMDSLRGRSGPFHHFRLLLPKGSRKRFHATIPAPGPDLSLWTFLCRTDGTVLASKELNAVSLKSDERLIAVAGLRPLGIELPQVKVAQVSPATLPEDWRGYSSVEALVWIGADPNLFPTAAHLDALRKWVSCGGRWIIDRSSVDSLLQSPLAEMVPIEPVRTRPVDDLDWAWIGSEIKGPALLLEAAPRRGTVVARHGEIPLVVDAAQDGGRVTFLAFDPTRDPFSTTEVGALLWTELVGDLPAASRPPRAPSPVKTAVGSDELLSLLASFPGVAVPELRRLFLFIFIFLAVAGPLDYLVLRRLRRLRLTWITFPSYIVILCVAIVVSGAGFMRNLVMQREIAVVDHYERTKFGRRRALEAILTPTDMTLASRDVLPLTSDFLFRRVTTAYSDMSDLTFRWDRGMSFRDWTLPRGATALAQADDCFESPTRLTWTVECPAPPEVAIVIRNDTGVELTRATLFSLGGIYSLGDLPPGESRRTCVPVRGPNPHSPQEERHTAQIQTLLEGLCFPSYPAVPVGGFAEDLDASPWIRAGGGVLIGWSRKLEPPVSFDPAPAHKTSVVLHRFFQESKP